MTRNQRFAMLGIAVVVVAIAAVVIGSSGSDDNGSTSSTPAGQSSTPSAPAAPAVAEIVIKDGKPVGGVRAIKFKKGDRARIHVTSDVADEVHLHGYDIMKDVAPGKDVTFSFPAKIDGEFEMELEGKKEQIASLVVQP